MPPSALTGLAALAAGFGLLASDAEGVIRWIGLVVAASGLALVVTVVIRTIRSEDLDSDEILISGLFILFAVSLALFGVAGLISRTAPGPRQRPWTSVRRFWQPVSGKSGLVTSASR